MSIATLGRVIHLPAAAGAASNARTNQPLGADLMQIASSNATHMCREGGLRVLFEDPGTFAAYRPLPTPANLDSFLWDGDPASGYYARFCGVHRLRWYGEQLQYPRVEVRCRMRTATTSGAAEGTYTGRLIVVATPGFAAPRYSIHPHASGAAVASYTLADVTATVTLPASGGVPARRTNVPRTSTTVPPVPPDEQGDDLAAGVWVGAYCDSNQSTDPVYVLGLTVYLREPA